MSNWTSIKALQVCRIIHMSYDRSYCLFHTKLELLADAALFSNDVTQSLCLVVVSARVYQACLLPQARMLCKPAPDAGAGSTASGASAAKIQPALLCRPTVRSNCIKRPECRDGLGAGSPKGGTARCSGSGQTPHTHKAKQLHDSS